MSEAILQIRDLDLCFQTEQGLLPVLRGVNLDLPEKATHGLVGESGCGKTVTALSILRLLPKQLAHYTGGEIRYRGQNLLTLAEKELRKIRGNRIAMIFQEPMTSLNPVFTIGNQIGEVLKVHSKLSRAEINERVEELLLAVGIAEAHQRCREYPHQLSGGLRQRVMIAMALACRPEILIADEPTTALDVTIQEQILQLIAELKQKFDMSMLLITHDLGVIAEQAQFISVMYAGMIVESAAAKTLIDNPLHPYTQGLYHSLPRVGMTKKMGELSSISGQVPAIGEPASGCPFADRCSIARSECRQAVPELIEREAGHFVRCPYSEGAKR